MTMIHIRSVVFLLALSVIALSAKAQTTADELWKEYAKNPNRHSHVPNNSFAGVHRGEKPIPDVAVAANVKEHGAKGDGQTDDTAAFKAAIAKAGGKGAVLIPAGKYKLSSHFVLPSHTVLRGEGPDETELHFTKPLNQTISPVITNKASEWSWTGGLIWIGPADTFAEDGKLAKFNTDRVQGWEYWRPTGELAAVTAEAKRGDDQITVNNASNLNAGQFVMMTWENPADASLLKHIAAHPAMEKYNWNSASWILPPQYPQWQWPVEIAAVKGNVVTLAQPLRLDIRAQWKVAMRDPGQYTTMAGVENLRFVLPAVHEHKHFTCVGWNAICFNRAYNCWARNIQVTGAENPVIFSSAKNCTVTKLLIDGDPMNHHSIACRVNSHDNLVHDFAIEGMWRVKHGINIEWLSSGNVYSKGKMAKGVFDSHRALSFDLIRTEITMTNEADGPGGAGAAGPFIGGRVAHWNVKVENSTRPQKGEFVLMPFTFPNGAFVGIQGCEVCTIVRDSVPGEKGSIIVDQGKEPAIRNLYEAQLKLRLGTK